MTRIKLLVEHELVYNNQDELISIDDMKINDCPIGLLNKVIDSLSEGDGNGYTRV